jgi:hypothetical protein
MTVSTKRECERRANCVRVNVLNVEHHVEYHIEISFIKGCRVVYEDKRLCHCFFFPRKNEIRFSIR